VNTTLSIESALVKILPTQEPQSLSLGSAALLSKV
jgi:hypothetical protein